MTRRKLAWAKNFIKEGMEPINNTIPLALTLCGLSFLALASFFELPLPYNLIALITILGPATITVYGLKKQLNVRKTAKSLVKKFHNLKYLSDADIEKILKENKRKDLTEN